MSITMFVTTGGNCGISGQKRKNRMDTHRRQKYTDVQTAADVNINQNACIDIMKKKIQTRGCCAPKQETLKRGDGPVKFRLFQSLELKQDRLLLKYQGLKIGFIRHPLLAPVCQPLSWCDFYTFLSVFTGRQKCFFALSFFVSAASQSPGLSGTLEAVCNPGMCLLVLPVIIYGSKLARSDYYPL